MALTVTLAGDWLSSVGNKKASTGTITFDAEYVAGGESLTPAMIGLGTIDYLSLNQGEDGYVFHYDKGNNKVMAYVTIDPADAGGANVVLQEAGAIDLSAVVVEFHAIGR
jgi:hypothetical protein